MTDGSRSPDTAEYVSPSASPSEPAAPRPGPTVEVDLAARTHVGKVRSNNEDNFLVVRFGRFLETMVTSLGADHAPPSHHKVGYGMVVADGMGGMAAGEIASRMAIRRLFQLVVETPDWVLGHEEEDVSEVIARTAQRFEVVNEAVLESAESRSDLKGMGTTLTLAFNLGRDLVIAHVGDSPIYLYRRGHLNKLTREHTVAAKMLQGSDGPDARFLSRFRHILTQAIGIETSRANPDLDHLHLEDGDRLLLCTDGLTDMVAEAAMADELSKDLPAENVCQTLVELALEGGGKDNVTAIVARYTVRE
jgi:PPM family protein phosphatase